MLDLDEGKGDRVGNRPGRPRSIPPELFATILKLYSEGRGYRTITNHLEGLGIATTYTTVRRLILGLGAYAKYPEADS